MIRTRKTTRSLATITESERANLVGEACRAIRVRLAEFGIHKREPEFVSISSRVEVAINLTIADAIKR